MNWLSHIIPNKNCFLGGDGGWLLIDFFAAAFAGSCFFFGPFILALALVPLFQALAHKFGILDRPNGALKVHGQPTAYLGGVAIYCATLITYIAVNFFIPQVKIFSNPLVPLYGAGLTVLLVGGLIDDIFTISPLKKLAIQTIACLMFVKAGLVFKPMCLQSLLPFLPQDPAFLAGLGIALTLWWMLSIINALNLIDIMDGLATSVSWCALVAMIGMGVAAPLPRSPMILLLVPFLGILAGFFLYNKPKASIYLGDAGSLFLGGVLATMPFFMGWGQTTSWIVFIAPCCFLVVPIFELCSLMLIRAYLRIPVYHGSPHHFAIYFKRRGWSTPTVLRVTGGVALCGALVGLMCVGVPVPTGIALGVLASAYFFLFFLCL